MLHRSDIVYSPNRGKVTAHPKIMVPLNKHIAFRGFLIKDNILDGIFFLSFNHYQGIGDRPIFISISLLKFYKRQSFPSPRGGMSKLAN